MFFVIILLVWVLMNTYVGWRICFLPTISQRMHRMVVAGLIAFLASSYLDSRLFNIHSWTGRGFELIGATWIGILFLASACFLAIDLITLFGFVLRRWVSRLRMLALGVAGLLSILALMQGHRPPEVYSYEVRMRGLPANMDNTVVVAASDLHLGSLVDDNWAQARVQQMLGLHPDLIIFCGDVIEGDDPSDRELLMQLADLKAPLGVWAVNGNHESHDDAVPLPDTFDSLGIRVLRNQWTEVRPGFVVAGVDDLTNARRQHGDPHLMMAKALSGIPNGAASILVSHSPLEAESAERAGTSLMLSGHTHDGQIWPFSYIVRELYPYMSGEYSIGNMKLIVCRGTGTWGPRMRLWHRGELVKVTLHPKV